MRRILGYTGRSEYLIENYICPYIHYKNYFFMVELSDAFRHCYQKHWAVILGDLVPYTEPLIEIMSILLM